MNVDIQLALKKALSTSRNAGAYLLARPVACSLGLAGLTCVVLDYRAWISYGTGGFPPNPLVYLVMSLFRFARLLFGADGRAASPLLKAGKRGSGRDQLKYIEDLPERRGPRPTVIGRPVPHRHWGEQQPAAVTEAVSSYRSRLARLNPTLLVERTSNLERAGPSLGLHPEVLTPREGKKFTDKWGKGEVVHVHENDRSLHVALSPLDAANVIQVGWGERFPLAGLLSFVPVGYVMIYAPRDLEEVEIVNKVVLASCRWYTGEEVVDE
ncbi:hypothetical protein BDY24DRAFT_412318 [Mrakia frigida]|uniref:uncharacterized protein n=1 Tax=Mrakia frigida TaxID=29902 RepID=UPI003FCC1C06